jgi:tryptophanyl-tRNA synthetase
MAADILLYDADSVPVGDDQRQHVELCRDIAIRFNSRYGTTIVVPQAAVPPAGARVMDLQHPERKMSKSLDSPLGTVGMLEAPDEISRKIRKAVTDADGEVRYDPVNKPGLSNLLEIFAAATSRSPQQVASSYERYGPLKEDLVQALVDVLGPVRERQAELDADPGGVNALLDKGAAKAAAIAAPTLERARLAVGLPVGGVAGPGRG